MSDKLYYRFAGLALSVAVLSLLYLLRPITIPILIATVVAYLLDPLIDKLETFNLGRSTSIALLTFFSVFFFSLMILLLIPAVESELKLLAKRLPEYFSILKNDVAPYIERQALRLFPDASYTISGLIEEGEGALKKIPVNMWNHLIGAMTVTIKGTLSLIISFIGALIIPLYLFYILKDFDRFKAQILDLIPPRNRDFWIENFSRVDEALGAFVRGQMMVCMTLALIYAAGLYMIGLDLAIVIGILSGIAFIIPYIGTFLGAFVASMMALLQFQDITPMFYVVALFVVAQLFEGMILTPKIVGEKVGLHPLAVILAIMIGGELFGLLGILLAVPFAATLNVFADTGLKRYRLSQFYNQQI